MAFGIIASSQFEECCYFFKSSFEVACTESDVNIKNVTFF